MRDPQNGNAKSSVSETLVEVTEETSSAATSVKETSFVISFKRKISRDDTRKISVAGREDKMEHALSLTTIRSHTRFCQIKDGYGWNLVAAFVETNLLGQIKGIYFLAF